jgi:hypothetical protein
VAVEASVEHPQTAAKAPIERAQVTGVSFESAQRERWRAFETARQQRQASFEDAEQVRLMEQKARNDAFLEFMNMFQSETLADEDAREDAFNTQELMIEHEFREDENRRTAAFTHEERSRHGQYVNLEGVAFRSASWHRDRHENGYREQEAELEKDLSNLEKCVASKAFELNTYVPGIQFDDRDLYKTSGEAHRQHRSP